MNNVFIKFNVEPIELDDHQTEIRAHIFTYDSELTRIKIGFAEMVQFNLANAENEGCNWLSLIDEVDDDTNDLFKPLVAGHARFTNAFQNMLDKTLEEVKSIIVIRRLFIKKEHRGNNLLPKILKVIRKFNDCPVALSPVPLQHATGTENAELMGYKGKKKESKKDFEKLRKHYESNGFKRVGKSKTWILI